MEGRQRISSWLKERLAGLGWEQIDLVNASHIGKSSVNKLYLGTQDLTIEMAEKIASVGALRTSREELIDVFLGKELTSKQKRLRQAALEQFDRLSYNQQEMALHLLTALERGERKQWGSVSNEAHRLSARGTMQDRPQLEKRLDALALSVDTLRRFTVLLTHIREDRHGRAWILLDAPLIGMPPVVIGGAP